MCHALVRYGLTFPLSLASNFFAKVLEGEMKFLPLNSRVLPLNASSYPRVRVSFHLLKWPVAFRTVVNLLITSSFRRLPHPRLLLASASSKSSHQVLEDIQTIFWGQYDRL